MQSKTKFKIGDKVRILSSAVSGGVDRGSVGKTGKITADDSYHSYFLVRMDEKRVNNSSVDCWAVYSNQISHATIKGQQLLLWEDM